MGREVTVKVVLNSKQAEQQAQELGRKLKTAFDQPRDELGRFVKSTDAAAAGIKSVHSASGELRSSLNLLRGAFAGLGIASVVSLMKQFADISIQAAINVDKQVNSLKALTGSAEAAKRRFAELFAIAQRSPGLTTNLAATLDAQLRIFDVNVKTIDRLLPVIGKLNAISPLGNPQQFVNNLTQLISQNFDRADLKELVGQSPIAGKLIKEIFNVDNPTNAEAIRASAKKLGVTTVERLAEELIRASETNQALKNATESLAGQFEKLQDRITVALAPIGDELLKAIMPALREFVELLERDLPKITALLRDNKDEFLAVAGAIVTMTDRVSQLIGVLGKFQIAENLNVVRLLSILAVSVAGGPGAGITLGRALVGADAQRARVAASLPFGLSIEETLGGIRNPVSPRSGGGGGGLGGGSQSASSAAATQAAKDQAKLIKEITEKIAKARNEFGEAIVKDLEEIEKAITGANLENVRREAERPGQLRSFSNAVAERIRRTELETLRLEENTRQARAETIQRAGRRGFNRSGALIDDALSRGQITGGEADSLRQAASRELASQLRLKEQLLAINDPLLDDLREEIGLYDRLGSAISDTERFARGFNSVIETSGDAFERFGQNVSNAFRNVRDLFNGLKSAVLGFFNDLLGNALQGIVRQTLGSIFGGGGGGARGGGGLGGILGGLFGGGGISVPGSVSSGATGIFANGAFGAGLRSAGGGGGGLGGALSGLFGGGGGGGGGFSFGGLLGGLAGAAPLLGLGLGAGFGGQSVGGQILGAIGGGAVGLGASFGASVFAAGGGLASAGLAALGPIGLIGIPLLIGASLLGKAKQRRADEEASGQMLTQALQGIEQIAQAVSSGQIRSLGEARGVFENNILGTFRQQISGLKTRSVVESRLKNQVADLRNVFESRIPPLIDQQAQLSADAARRAAIDARLIPQFASGGTTMGGLALLHPGEKVLNFSQQSAVIAQSNPNVFERAGVPGPGPNRVFDIGGTMGSGGGGQPINISFGEVRFVISSKTAEGIYIAGARSDTGRAITVDNFKQARVNREV